jgi:hypothetical protein
LTRLKDLPKLIKGFWPEAEKQIVKHLKFKKMKTNELENEVSKEMTFENEGQHIMELEQREEGKTYGCSSRVDHAPAEPPKS